MCLAISLIAPALLRFMETGASYRVRIALLNFQTLFGIGFGALAIIFGIALASRWILAKANHVSARRKAQSTAQTCDAVARWNALLRYDDEIRAAAEQLRPFGDTWVDELSQAYFALHEDRKYLPNIVSRLVEKAERDKVQQWASRFRQTADGQLCTEESLNILRQAELIGYTLAVEKDRSFSLTKSGMTYLRSNSEIQRFGRMVLRSPKESS
jgi:hypothetical protein